MWSLSKVAESGIWSVEDILSDDTGCAVEEQRECCTTQRMINGRGGEKITSVVVELLVQEREDNLKNLGGEASERGLRSGSAGHGLVLVVFE